MIQRIKTNRRSEGMSIISGSQLIHTVDRRQSPDLRKQWVIMLDPGGRMITQDQTR
jgi:hypothetical protein